MATKIEEILGRDINSVKELKEAIRDLQDSIANAEKTDENYIKTQEKIAAAQEQLASVTRGYKDSVTAATDSIVGMQREYKQLYNDYKMMTEAERNSPLGRETVAHLNELSNKLNETKKEAGNFKDNIGRYSESIIDAFGKMGISLGALQGPVVLLTKLFEEGSGNIITSINNVTATLGNMSKQMSSMGGPMKAVQTGIQGLSGALKALLANPVVATLAAIVVAFKAFMAVVNQVKKAINENEQSQMALKEAMSQFQPVIDAVKNAFDKLGQMVVKVIGFVSDAFAKLREIRGAVTDFLGLTKGAQAAVKEQNALYKEIAKSENELILKKREYQKLSAGDKAEVERLREEASETENLTQKKELLEQAKAKQEEIDNRQIEIAKEELRILEEQASLTANDAEMNERLASAVAAVAEAEATAATNARRFNREIKNVGKSAGGTKSKMQEMREEAEKIYQRTVEDSKDEMTKVTEKYEYELKQLKKFHKDTTYLTEQYNKRMKELRDEQYNTQMDKYGEEVDKQKHSGDLVVKAMKTEVERMKETLKQSTEQEDKLREIFAKYQNTNLETMKKYWLDIFNKTAGETAATEKDMSNIIQAMHNSNIKGYEDLMSLVMHQNMDAAQNAIDQITTLIERYRLENDEGKQSIAEGLKKLITKYNVFDENEFEQMMSQIGTSAGASEWIQKALYEWREENKYLLEKLITDLADADDQTKIQLMSEYLTTVQEQTDALVQVEELAAERVRQVWDDAFSTFDTHTSSIQTVIGSYSSLIEAQRNDSKITKQESEKKKKTLKDLEKVALAVNLAQIMASTVAGVQDIYRSYTAELALNAETAAATGPAAAATKAALDAKSLASAIMRATAVISTGAANAAAAVNGTKAKLLQMDQDSSGGGGVSTAANVQEIDSTPYSYTRQVQTVEEEDAIYNKEYFVSVTDINNVQNRVKVTEGESSF